MPLDHIGSFISGERHMRPERPIRVFDEKAVRVELPDIGRLSDELYCGSLDARRLSGKFSKLNDWFHNCSLPGNARKLVEGARVVVEKVLKQRGG